MPQKTRNADARARAQARREAIARQEKRRRQGFAALWGTIGIVVVLVVVLIFALNIGKKNDVKDVTGAAPATLTQQLATVPASLFSSVGAGSVGSRVDGIHPISGGAPITTDGKPTFVYAGGVFCPYCAAERWAMVVALDRFGSFTGLQTTRSAADDGNYATLDFQNATYTSQYIVFDGKEIYNRARGKLQTLDAAAMASYAKYGTVGSVPYISINNQYTSAVQYDDSELGTFTADEIASQINAGTTQLAKDIITSANVLTAGICKADGNMPSAVCAAPEVVAAAANGLTAADPTKTSS